MGENKLTGGMSDICSSGHIILELLALELLLSTSIAQFTFNTLNPGTFLST